MTSSENLIPSLTREIEQCLRAVSSEQLDAAVEAIDRAERIFVAGAGRSGLAMRAFAMRLMHLGKTAYVVGDVTTPGVKKHDLLLIGSGSGSTGSLRIQAEKASRFGAMILLFTIAPGSPIGSEADLEVHIPAPSPKARRVLNAVDSIQPMGSLFEQTLFLLGDILILRLMEQDQRNSNEMFELHANLE
jgi:6-phospho-3-hexuloisomerase